MSFSKPSLLALLAAVAVAVVATLVVLLTDTGESAGPEDGTTLRDIASSPRAYAGRDVLVSGEVAENDYLSLADANIAFAIGDDAGERVLVLPQPGTTVPELTEDAVVSVRGRVALIGPDEQTDGGYLEQGGLLVQSGAEVAIEASSITVPGLDLDDVPRDPPARRTTVTRLLADPRAWDDRPVVVRGRAYPIGPPGFVLAAGDRTIFVGAPASDLSRLEPGEPVRIRAELERISRFRASSIREAIAGTPETDASAPDRIELDQTPTGEGRPFLVLRRFVPEDASG